MADELMAVQPGNLTIVPQFDASVTSSADAANYEAAVNSAINFLESHLTTATPITLTIAFSYGELNGAPLAPDSGGVNSRTEFPVSYARLYDAIQATDDTSVVQQDAAASLSSTDPTGGASIAISVADLAALGIYEGYKGIDGTVGISTASYTWSQSGGIAPNTIDAVGVFEHEITEVMGRFATGGADDTYSPLDFFRYTAADGGSGDPIGSAAGDLDEPFVSGYSADANSYFSYDGKTVTLQYDSPSAVTHHEDVADWNESTVGADSFDSPTEPGVLDPVSATDLQELNVLGYDLVTPCFVAGTRMATAEGAVAVEHLQIGDRVKTAAGDFRPIRWLGSRQVNCDHYRDPSVVWPIRILSGAFAENLSARDLWLSPGHSILIDGVLMQACNLVNGATITQIPRGRVEYWHVELESHDIILAEGLATESYLDTGNRTAFCGGGDFIEAHPDFQPKHWAETCVPLVQEGPQLVQAKTALLARAAELGYVTTEDSDVHLTVDGERLDPIALTPTRIAFVLPAVASVIELRSRTFVPAHVDPRSSDRRALGICVGRIQIDGADVALDSETAFESGWHALEHYAHHQQRWTRDSVRIPSGTRLIVIDVASRSYGWAKAPESAYRDATRARDVPIALEIQGHLIRT